VAPVGANASAQRPPRAGALSCLERCADLRAASVGGRIAIIGSHLGAVSRVEFHGRSGFVPVSPAVSHAHRVEVVVPGRSRSGRLRLADPNGRRDRTAKPLRIVSARRLPPPGAFDLIGARVRPHRAFVDGRRPATLSFRFRARASADVRVKLVRKGNTKRTWSLADKLPYKTHRLRWDGIIPGDGAAPPGHYRSKVQRPGHRAHPSARFRLYDGEFPVRGQHDYGGAVQRFGAPRSGGRVHQGQDVFAACGTRLVAARGGSVQARGSDPVLYGNWIVIDARGTKTDYRYAHFLHPASVHDGERVRTGQTIGRVGKTGNARTVGCQLHFEVWPRGWEHGSPIDPLGILKRWDRWS
jgi:murein DD-endopeptidase MepM/ murein hydrolase activator NlpD